MARDMSDKEILKMELEQLKKEVSTARTPVSKLPLFKKKQNVMLSCQQLWTICSILSLILATKSLYCIITMWKAIRGHIYFIILLACKLILSVSVFYEKTFWFAKLTFVFLFPLNGRWVQTVQKPSRLLRECYQMTRWLRAFQMTRTPTRGTREAV